MESVKTQAQDTVKRSTALAQDAVTSYGWLYPIYGISYLASHKKLQKPLLKLILPSLAISATVVAFAFTFLYLPQAAILSIVQLGPLGFVTAFSLVLAESGFIINQILKTFLLADTLTETFDNVLLIKGLDSLVATGRELSQPGGAGAKGGKALGKLLTKPLNKLSPEAIAKYLLTIPLNAIPLVGTAVFFAINGTRNGPAQMARYHELKQFTPDQRQTFTHAHRGAYTALGVVSLLLTLVPVVGPVVFSYSNAVGAALLAADLEKRQGKVVEGERAIKGGVKKDL